MMAAARKSVNAIIGAVVDQRMSWVKDAAEAQAKIRRTSVALDALLRHLPANAFVTSYSDDIEITLQVKAMEDTVPWIESLQEVTGHEFDSSEDETQYGLSRRVFRMTKFPLRLNANVSSDDEGAKCRAVVVGERIVPIIELRCDDSDGGTNA